MAKQQASEKTTSDRRQFKIGKYDIIAQPASGSAHMLRYTVMLNDKRLPSRIDSGRFSDNYEQTLDAH